MTVEEMLKGYVRISVWDSVGGSVRDSVRDSVHDSVRVQILECHYDC